MTRVKPLVWSEHCTAYTPLGDYCVRRLYTGTGGFRVILQGEFDAILDEREELWAAEAADEPAAKAAAQAHYDAMVLALIETDDGACTA